MEEEDVRVTSANHSGLFTLRPNSFRLVFVSVTARKLDRDACVQSYPMIGYV